MTRILFDPTAELNPSQRPRPARASSLEGETVALLDIGKARGNVFLDELAERLKARGAAVNRYSKPTFTRVAPMDLKQQIAVECTMVIEALAD